MNKLYKYLPFDIQLQDRFTDFSGTLVSIDLYDNVCVSGWLHEVKENASNFKPILRPFEDLVKQLPLTKYAAEIVGMNEGECICIIKGFCWILYNYYRQQNKRNIEIYQSKTGFLQNQDGIWLGEPLKNIRFTGINYEEDCELTPEFRLIVNNNIHRTTLYVSEAFDFLRAMHFAVGLNENEYIKLI